MKLIAVDLDNTLTKSDVPLEWKSATPNQYLAYYINAAPNQEIIDKVNRLYDQGYRIYVYTARDIFYRACTEMWLLNHKVKHTTVVYNKLAYDVLLDDKATNSISVLETILLGSKGICP